MRAIPIAIACVLALSVAPPAFGQVTKAAMDTTTACNQIDAYKSGMPVPAKVPDLKHFGAGFAADKRTSGPNRIREAEVVGGRVMVTDVDNATVGPVLEAHAGFAIVVSFAW